jgi:hypothetical protein
MGVGPSPTRTRWFKTENRAFFRSPWHTHSQRVIFTISVIYGFHRAQARNFTIICPRIVFAICAGRDSSV